jgi:hypothetical protein
MSLRRKSQINQCSQYHQFFSVVFLVRFTPSPRVLTNESAKARRQWHDPLTGTPPPTAHFKARVNFQQLRPWKLICKFREPGVPRMVFKYMAD